MNRKIDYKIINPGGNITALVDGLDYTKDEMKIINDKILNRNKDIEQVGFIDLNRKTIVMAGGEFCLNAVRCAIWRLLNGNDEEVKINVLGSDNEIFGGIKKGVVFVNYKIERNINEIISFSNNYKIVNLDGITLVVIDEIASRAYIKQLKEDEIRVKNNLKEIMKNINTDEKAIGIILLETVDKFLKINPVIWVKEIDTLYYETACGSGSLAATLYKCYMEDIKKMKILQPSGFYIEIDIEGLNDYIDRAIVRGKIVDVKQECISIDF